MRKSSRFFLVPALIFISLLGNTLSACAASVSETHSGLLGDKTSPTSAPRLDSANDRKLDGQTPSTTSNTYGTELLQMTLDESITILDDGSSHVDIVINVPSSLLAEAYRKTLGLDSNVAVDEEISIPETMLISPGIHADGMSTNIVSSVRERFYDTIEREQEVSLGIVTEITSSKVVPRSSDNSCKVLMSARGLLPISDTSGADLLTKWEIGFGGASTGATAESMFTSIVMAQMMLRSIPGEQLYECFWRTKISLPEEANVVNVNALSCLEWKVAFGGGTYVTAWVELEDSSTIELVEKRAITEHSVTVSPRSLQVMLSRYKTFTIVCTLPNLAPISSEEFESQTLISTESDDSFSYTWTESWSDTASASFAYGPLSAELTATATLTISGYVGWNFDLFQGLTSFESWMSLGASIEVGFEAIASASYSKTWEQEFFGWTATYSFLVGLVPVWADMRISATGVLSASAYGQISVTASATVSGSLRAGVRWSSDQGWSPISEVNTGAAHSGPSIEAEAGVCIRPSVRFRIAFLFYGVAGPFLEFEPYAVASLTCTYPPPHGEWEITANLQITAGATFVGWLKDLLGLDDWSVLLCDAELLRWSGSWGSTTITITETLNPSTSSPDGSVLVSGVASLDDGSAVSFTDVIVAVSGSSWTTTTDASGSYYVFISAPSSEGQHAVQVRITTGSLTATNSQILTVSRQSPSGSRFTLYRTATCKDVQANDPNDPIDETAVFRRSDAKAIVWLHFTDVYENGPKLPLIRVKWEFYDPAGSFYSTTEQIISDPGEGYYWLWYKIWGWVWISGYQAADLEGRWHCKVYIDEGSGYQFKLLHEFVIGYEVTDRTTSKDVQLSDPYEPITRTDAFLNTDPKAWGWIRLDEVAESLEIKWEWFEPSTSKYGEFFWTSTNPTGYWDWYKAWCWIDINGYAPQSKLGLWQVKAYIKDVYGNWDLEYSQYFMISDNTPPGVPGSPSDGGDHSTTGTITWNWVPASEDGTVARYQIQVGTTPNGNNVLDGYVSDLGKTLYDLPSGVTYYARVRAMNSVGQWGSWSPCSDGITVDRPPVTIIVEGPDETAEYYDVLFTWKGTDDVTPSSNLVYSYYLQGKDASWSTWQSATGVEYDNLPDGSYQFLVKARDLHGSEDQTPANRTFSIATYSVHLESESISEVSPNLGTVEFGNTNYTLPADVRTRRTMDGNEDDVYSLPAGAKRMDPGDLTLEGTKLLQSLSLNDGGQTVTVNPGETVSVDCTYQLWSPVNPNELDQLFFIYSWTPSWPPTSDYYYGIYHGIPGLPPGVSSTASFTFAAPSSPGTYYLYWCYGCHYGIPQAVSAYTQALSSPSHAKIIVGDVSAQYTAKYNPEVGFFFDHWAAAGGISIPNATVNPTTVTVGGNGTLRAVYMPSPDVAVTTALISKTIVGRGHALSVNVTVQNQGIHTETFSVTLYANTTAIEEIEITLGSGSFTTIAFTWDTTTASFGNYTITANASSPPGETDIVDNMHIGGFVTVTISGDANGDKTVNVLDILAVKAQWGRIPSSPDWNPNVDVNDDLRIDVFDILTIKAHWGEAW